MAYILYDNDCENMNRIARKIQSGIQREYPVCNLMTINNIEESTLNSAKCIIFGCESGMTGVAYTMAKFMDKTRDRFENQIWKNKLAAGFTLNNGANSSRTIEDLCNFAARHSMIWISQGHLAENEGHGAFYGSSVTRINSNKSFLGCITTLEEADLTAEYFGRRIGQQLNILLNPIRY